MAITGCISWEMGPAITVPISWELLILMTCSIGPSRWTILFWSTARAASTQKWLSRDRRGDTDKGILLIYNSGDDHLVYRTGWVLFDKTDPTKVLARPKRPFLSLSESGRKWAKCRMSCLSKG